LVGPAASVWAILVASSTSRSSSTAFQIKPHRSGVFRRQALAESASPIARALPTSRGRKYVPPESGTSPSFENDWTKLAERAASTMSQARAILAPAPAATPFTAHTTGLGRARRRRTSGL
jgi:hypothetical protein